MEDAKTMKLTCYSKISISGDATGVCLWWRGRKDATIWPADASISFAINVEILGLPLTISATGNLSRRRDSHRHLHHNPLQEFPRKGRWLMRDAAAQFTDWSKDLVFVIKYDLEYWFIDNIKIIKADKWGRIVWCYATTKESSGVFPYTNSKRIRWKLGLAVTSGPSWAWIKRQKKWAKEVEYWFRLT